MTDTYALTLWQPRASLVALGVKTIETRGWPCPSTVRLPFRVLIHAAAKPPPWSMTTEPSGFIGDWWVVDNREAGDLDPVLLDRRPGAGTIYDLHSLPLGAVVAVATVTDWLPMVDRWPAPGDPPAIYVGTRSPLTVVGSWPARPGRKAEDQRPYGDFSPGRYGLLLADVQPLRRPVPAKGRQKLWRPSSDLLAAVDAEVEP